MSRQITTVSVAFGNDLTTATVRFSGRSRPVVANILGTDKDPQGNVKRVYLDSLIHKDGGAYKGWEPTGCISTILTRV